VEFPVVILILKNRQSGGYVTKSNLNPWLCGLSSRDSLPFSAFDYLYKLSIGKYKGQSRK